MPMLLKMMIVETSVQIMVGKYKIINILLFESKNLRVKINRKLINIIIKKRIK